jgi:hypothetical protein
MPLPEASSTQVPAVWCSAMSGYIERTLLKLCAQQAYGSGSRLLVDCWHMDTPQIVPCQERVFRPLLKSCGVCCDSPSSWIDADAESCRCCFVYAGVPLTDGGCLSCMRDLYACAARQVVVGSNPTTVIAHCAMGRPPPTVTCRGVGWVIMYDTATCCGIIPAGQALCTTCTVSGRSLQDEGRLRFLVGVTNLFEYGAYASLGKKIHVI